MTANRLQARTCERCGHAFVVAIRFTTTICGPCELARSAQKTVIDEKLEQTRTKPHDVGRVTQPAEEE